MVRAKFRVEEITKGTNTAKILLLPVSSGSEENKQFFKYTPGGEVKLTIVSFETADHFKPGDEFYLDFTKAEKENK